MKNKTVVLYALILLSFLLLFFIFQRVDQLQVIECLSGSGNSDLPLTTPTETCQNICGPMARCSQTGDQCVLDSDCPMCPPPIPENSNRVSDHAEISAEFAVGDNDSGKSVGRIPVRSHLTESYPHEATIFAMKNPIQMGNLLGVNTWANKFNNGMNFYKQRYEEPSAVYYAPRTTLSGEFPDDGPFPANA